MATVESFYARQRGELLDRRPEVDDHMEPGGLLDRNISWQHAFQNLVDLSCWAMAAFERARAKTIKQPTATRGGT
jgi:hypothetical protein